MSISSGPRLACLATAALLACPAWADSFASSASSATSAASGSVSDSLTASSDSSSSDKQVADGDYRIIDVAHTPGRQQHVRVTMQSEGEAMQRVVLDLPAQVLAQQGLGQGDWVRTQKRVYGFEFARRDTQQAFYLVLADDWHDELASRPVLSAL